MAKAPTAESRDQGPVGVADTERQPDDGSTRRARRASRGLRVAAVIDHLRGSLWTIPAAFVAVSLILAGILVRVETMLPARAGWDLLVPKSAEGARSALQTVAGSIITGTSIVYSLTVVALQMSAAQYSPRVLRTFLRDRSTQVVLGTFLATFVYAFVVLHNIRAGSDPARWTPQLAVALVPPAVLATVTALVYFIHRLTQAIRIETILREVRDETLKTVERVYPPDGRWEYADVHPERSLPPHATEVAARHSGFVQSVSADAVVPYVAQGDIELVLHAAVGDHVVEGARLASAWRRDGSGGLHPGEVAAAVDGAIQYGNERTMQQDVAFGIRQLVDVAVRALSPGVNDPNTAVTAIGSLAVVYAALSSRQLGRRIHRDEEGRVRLTVVAPTFDGYLTIGVQQIAHYGRSDVMVLLRMMRMLADLRGVASPANAAVLESHVARVLAEGESGLALEVDRAELRRAADDARAGRWHTGNASRAG